MDYRRWCWWAEWGLVAAVVGLHAVIFLWPEGTQGPGFRLVSLAKDTQVLASAALILGWLILGTGRLVVRVPITAALLAIWAFGVMRLRYLPVDFVATMFCATALILVGMKVWRFRISTSAESLKQEGGAQYSMLSLMVVITGIGLVVGLLEALRPTLGAFRNANGGMNAGSGWLIAYQVREIVLAGAVALTGIGGLWVVLRPGTVWLRLGAVTALIAATGVYLSHLTGDVGEGFVSTAVTLGMAFGAVAGMCAISALPMRVMGFRLARTKTGSRREPGASGQWTVARSVLGGEVR